jgi:hypothetical protein
VSTDFHLIDLVSQARAVQALLRGRSDDEKLSWLASHGSIEPKRKVSVDERQSFWFVSRLGVECCFFLDGDEFVFLGDHTTFMVKEPAPA